MKTRMQKVYFFSNLLLYFTNHLVRLNEILLCNYNYTTTNHSLVLFKPLRGGQEPEMQNKCPKLLISTLLSSFKVIYVFKGQ